MAQIFSVMGNPTFYMAFSALAFIHFRFIQFNSIQANRALFFLLSVVTSIICVSILKATFGRARPDLYFEYGVYGFRPFYMGQAFSSFPSEHAAIAATIAAMLSLIRPTYRIAFCALALFVAASRVLLMAHYVSDVLTGLLLGGLIVFELKIAFDHFGQSLQIGNSRQGRTRS